MQSSSAAGSLVLATRFRRRAMRLMLPLELKIAVTNPDAENVLFIWCWLEVAVLGYREWNRVVGVVVTGRMRLISLDGGGYASSAGGNESTRVEADSCMLRSLVVGLEESWTES